MTADSTSRPSRERMAALRAKSAEAVAKSRAGRGKALESLVRAKQVFNDHPWRVIGDWRDTAHEGGCAEADVERIA